MSMYVHLMIDTGSKQEAELVASSLPGEPAVSSARGFGLIRLRFRRREVQAVIDKVGEAAQEHGLSWVRVRHGDEERVFRNGSHRAG
jgi:hypothetical protein